MTRRDVTPRPRRTDAGPGADLVRCGDEFDPKAVASRKWEVSGRETEPELSIEALMAGAMEEDR